MTERGNVEEGSRFDDGGGNAVKRGRNVGEEFPELDSSHSSSSSEDEEGIDGELWPQSGVHSQAYRRRMAIWKNEFKGKGQLFASAEAVRHSMWRYAIANKFDYKFVRNCRKRIAVTCKVNGCPFYICVRGHVKMDGMYVKEFVGAHVHSVGDDCMIGKWGGRRMRANLLGSMIEGKVSLSVDYPPSEIMKDLQLELGIKVSYMQCWRAREYVRMLAMGRPEDHYKLLPWLCAAITRANPDSRAFVELDGCRFKRMFVALGASLNGFILGCRKILFVDGTHLSGPYDGTLLGAVALDADNHLFDVAYAIVSSENKEDWEWFLQNVRECLGGFQPVVMSDRNNALLYAVPKVFGIECHTYCVRHIRENFVKAAAKYGYRKESTKDLLKEMLNRVAYAASAAEYGIAMDELRKFQRELAVWVEDNEPERWAQSKFLKDRWGRLNNNAIESWNKWMRSLRSMPIPWLIVGHIQKIGLKYEKRKKEMQLWKDGVGSKIEHKLRETLGLVGSVTDIKLFSSTTGEYGVLLTNNRRLVVNLTRRTCNCRW